MNGSAESFFFYPLIFRSNIRISFEGKFQMFGLVLAKDLLKSKNCVARDNKLCSGSLQKDFVFGFQH